MKRKCILLFCVFMIGLAGCTTASTRIAQDGSFKSQAVYDGVHRDIMSALSRENFETAKMTILLRAEKSKQGQVEDVQAEIDALASSSIDVLKSFAKKRDHMLSWDRDHERANAYKYVTVDSKLFSEQGILNYIASTFSEGSSKVFDAWDAAKDKWKVTEDKSQ